MRRSHIDITIFSNQDLTALNSSRVKFEALGDNQYRATSTIKLHQCERHNFIYRLIKRNYKITSVYGNASCPNGYELEESPKLSAIQKESISKLIEKYKDVDFSFVSPSKYGNGYKSAIHARNATNKNAANKAQYEAQLLFLEKNGKLGEDDYMKLAEISSNFFNKMERAELELDKTNYFYMNPEKQLEVKNAVVMKLQKHLIIKRFLAKKHKEAFRSIGGCNE